MSRRVPETVCPDCGKPIRFGDLIVRRKLEWIHVECTPDDRPLLLSVGKEVVKWSGDPLRVARIDLDTALLVVAITTLKQSFQHIGVLMVDLFKPIIAAFNRLFPTVQIMADRGRRGGIDAQHSPYGPTKHLRAGRRGSRR